MLPLRIVVPPLGELVMLMNTVLDATEPTMEEARVLVVLAALVMLILLSPLMVPLVTKLLLNVNVVTVLVKLPRFHVPPMILAEVAERDPLVRVPESKVMVALVRARPPKFNTPFPVILNPVFVLPKDAFAPLNVTVELEMMTALLKVLAPERVIAPSWNTNVPFVLAEAITPLRVNVLSVIPRKMLVPDPELLISKLFVTDTVEALLVAHSFVPKTPKVVVPVVVPILIFQACAPKLFCPPI